MMKLNRQLIASLLSLSVSIAWATNPLIQPINLPPIAQNAFHYLPSGRADVPVISDQVQEARAKQALEGYLSPWAIRSIQDVSFDLSQGGLYGYNFHPLNQSWIRQIKNNRDSSATGPRQAIVVHDTALRALPTELPIYGNYRRAGEGYPFDLLQLSAEWAGKPIAVSKLSQDGAWAFINDGDVQGWVNSNDVAYVQASDIQKISHAKFVAITKDNLPIKDNENNFLFYSRIGMLFPSENGKILVPLRNERGDAVFEFVKIDRDAIQDYPIKATPRNFAQLINQMLGAPYGWGGLYNERDCSLTMKNLMLPFGIALPRNSQAQAEAGDKISLAHLSDQEKQAIIQNRGIPFMTLLHMHGHIVLYMGSINGDGIIFHNKWGIATDDGSGNAGRAVLGQAHIAPLSFGSQVPNSTTSFIRGVDSMTLLIKAN